MAIRRVIHLASPRRTVRLRPELSVSQFAKNRVGLVIADDIDLAVRIPVHAARSVG
jgi:hypothetical protein